MSDQTIPTFDQLLNAVLPYSYDVNPFANANGLSVNTITAVSSDSSVSLGTETSNSGIWKAPLTAATVGSATITLTTTFNNSTVVRKRKFKVTVTDP